MKDHMSKYKKAIVQWVFELPTGNKQLALKCPTCGAEFNKLNFGWGNHCEFCGQGLDYENKFWTIVKDEMIPTEEYRQRVEKMR